MPNTPGEFTPVVNRDHQPFKSVVCLMVAFILAVNAYSQHINDCPSAQVVCSSENLAFNPNGPGVNDFADPDNNPGCIVDLEQNSAWYYFEIDPAAPPDQTLGFIIHPNGGLGEDYDWALYGPDVVCGDLGNPIRCSSSSAACGFCPETGMGMGATDFTEGPGTGDGFVMTLQVEPGQGFYLLIDNWQGTMNGFELEWTDSASSYLNCEAQPPCALSAIAGSDLSACEGDETAIQLNGSSYGSHGNEVYSWSGTNGGTGFLSDPDIANPTITLPPNFNGTIIYTLTVTEDTCTGTDELELTVNPLPFITINTVGPFCENNPTQTLSGTPAGGTWGGAVTSNMFNPVTHGPGIHTVTYTYTDFNGCMNTTSMDIEVYELPNVTVDPDPAEFCDDEGSVLLTAIGSDGAGSYLFNWNTPTGTGDGNTYNASLSGSHHITVTDANGCSNTSITLVTSHANPEVEIIDPGAICASEEFVQLTGIPSGGEFTGTVITADGELLPNITPGVYTISYTYTDAFGCAGTDFQNITIVTVPNAVAENNSPLCAGGQILLYGQTDSTGANFTYQWTGPGGYTSNLQNPANATLAGPYILHVLNEECASLPDTTHVILTSMPDATAMNDGPYCNGQTIQLFGNTNTTGTSITYAWSGPNGYTSNLQNPVDATAAGVYTLIITVDNCSSAAAMTEVIFNNPPAATATNTGPYCAGETVQLSGSTSTSGSVITYTWSGPNGYSSNTQNPAGQLQPGIYNLIVNVDGCNSAATTTEVVINGLPQPVITGDNTFCTGFSSTLDAGTGYAGYLWSNGSTNQTIQVFSSGTYDVIVTDQNGCTGLASVNVTETPSLTPVISGNLNFCEGSSTILDAGPGYISYEWSTGETSQTISVTTEGNFGVIVMDSDGCSGSANITTVINTNPVVMIGGSTTYCIGGFTVLDAGSGYSSYMWSDNSTSQSITVSTPGIYSVDVVDVNGCTGSGSVTITESTSLSPVITGSNAFCENGNTTLNAGSGFASYLWSNGSTSQNLIVNMTGTYTVTVSDGQGCSGESSIAVVEVMPPTAQLRTDTILCNTQAGGSVINLYDLILSGDMNGTWTDVDQSGAVGLFSNLNFANIQAGNYRFIYTTNSAIAPCPEATYEIIITILDCTCPDVFFLNAPGLCNADGMLDLTSIENTDETGIWSLIQSPPGTNPVILNGSVIQATGSDAGQYVFQFELLDPQPPGCPAEFQVSINVDANVDAGTALQPVRFCFNETHLVNLFDLISDEDSGGTWSESSVLPSQGGAFNPANGTFATSIQPPGTYSFKYTLPANGSCPGDTSEVTVIIDQLPIVMLGTPSELDCTHSTQTLDGTGSSSGVDYYIEWTGPGIVHDGNENTLRPTIDKPGNYILMISNVMTGCANTASVTVDQNTDSPYGAVIISEDPSCFGESDGSIDVERVFGGTPPYLYSYNSSPFINMSLNSNMVEGQYTLVVQDANGCSWDTVITLNEPPEVNVDVGPDIELEFGDDTVIQAIINIPSSMMDTLIWSPDDIIDCIDLNCLQVNVHPFKTVKLLATLIDENGCEATDDILITIKKGRRVYIPTVFSPNDDNINDIFFISGAGRQINTIKKFQIYTRWGELVHEVSDIAPNDPSKGWTGRFKGEVMNPGVYVYRALILYIDGLEEIITGDVTLLR